MRRKPMTDYEKSLFARFGDQMKVLKSRLTGLGSMEAILGTVGCCENETAREDVAAMRAGLAQMGLAGKSVVLCVGHRDDWLSAKGIQEEIEEGDVPYVRFTLDGDLGGYGWQVRALVEAASTLHSTLLILPLSLAPQRGGADEPGQWCSPDGLKRLLDPVLTQEQDLALARFNLHPLAKSVEAHLVFPMLAGVFGWRVRQAAPGILAMSRQLVRSCLSSDDPWTQHVGEHGFSPWIVIHAIVNSFRICEVPFGVVSWRSQMTKLKVVFREVAHVLLREVTRHEKVWLARHGPVQRPAVAGPEFDTPPHPYVPDTEQLRRRFKLEFNHYDDTLYPDILSVELRRRIEDSIESDAACVDISPGQWIRLLRDFLVAYRFEHQFNPDDIVDGLFPFFLGRLVSFIDEYTRLHETLTSVRKIDKATSTALVRHEAERRIESQADICMGGWRDFREAWQSRERTTTSYLPRLGAWQFVPNVGVIVPQELEGSGEHSVWAYQVYKEVVDRYRAEYTDFVTKRLGVTDPTDSTAVLEKFQDFMHKLEKVLGEHVFPFDISTVEGAREMAKRVCGQFVEAGSFHLTPDAAARILQQAPPTHLIMAFRCRNVRGLLERLEPQDALGMTAWTDQQHYLNRILDVLEKQAEPDWFQSSPLETRILDVRQLPHTTELNGTAALARLTGRVITVNAPRSGIDSYPKLWFFLRLLKSIIGVELFSQIWFGFAEEKIDFPARLVASIRGHWGRRVLSAHNAFENKHQRILAARLKKFAGQLAGEGPGKTEAADVLKAAADVYHLSITLPDATFVPLSAWTWVSFRNRGGIGTPTPLSSLVERDWATRDFFATYLERAGLGGDEAIDAKTVELIGTGLESEDLRTHMLGVSADPDSLVVTQVPSALPLPARKLVRPLDGPLLEPTQNAWETRYVLNAAAFRIDGIIFILYRALGDDKVSRIGLAWTKDGLHIDGRLDEPIFSPSDTNGSAGCEDPRTVIIGDRIYMLYTEWDHKVAQIAMASMSVDAFLARRFDAWERHGFAFPGLANKDAVLYPEKIGGRYVVYHRIDPNMWVSYLDDLRCPWPRTGQQIFVGPRSGMMWDGVKIGAGGPPIKTTHGWLNIYHGVDYEGSYRLGVMFMPFGDPSRVIYRSPNPILEPETDYEMGDGKSWVPHVVFTCGALPAEDKEVVGPDDEILVYYGAADTVIGVARGKLRDIVPVLD